MMTQSGTNLNAANQPFHPMMRGLALMFGT
jgi:hypothetical protein